MNNATISADIISFTTLSDSQRQDVAMQINSLLKKLTTNYHDQVFYGRLIQGDYIECALDVPTYILRIALLLKTFVKSIDLETGKTANRELQYFFQHGIRLAIAVAPLSKLDIEKGIIDGEAIFMSGREIKKHSSAEKQKTIIKQSMFFLSHDERLQAEMDTIFSLIDTILSGCSPKQSKVLYYKLLGLTEKEISKELNRDQSTINQHSTAAGWISLEKAVHHFERVIS